MCAGYPIAIHSFSSKTASLFWRLRNTMYTDCWCSVAVTVNTFKNRLGLYAEWGTARPLQVTSRPNGKVRLVRRFTSPNLSRICFQGLFHWVLGTSLVRSKRPPVYISVHIFCSHGIRHRVAVAEKSLVFAVAKVPSRRYRNSVFRAPSTFHLR